MYFIDDVIDSILRFFVCLVVFLFVSNNSIARDFTSFEEDEIYNLSKMLVYHHEVSPKNRIKNLPDLTSYTNGEIIKGRKIYTACYGNTTIQNSKGAFVRYIEENETFTQEQCEEIFKNHFLFINKELRKAMFQDNINYYNKLHYLEVPLLIDILWHNGFHGSRHVIKAYISYIKNRNEFTLQTVLDTIDISLKKHSKFNFTNRRNTIKRLMQCIFDEEIWLLCK